MLDHKTRWSGILALSLLTACSSSAPETSRDTDSENAEDEVSDSDRTSTRANNDAGKKSDAGNKSDAGSELPRADAIPCAVDEILEKHCKNCHGATPTAAPFALASLADFQGPFLLDASRTTAEAAHAAVTASDPRDRMPPASVSQLTAAEVKTLGDWLEDGAKPGIGCDEEGREDDAGTAQPDAGSSRGGSGGASASKIDYDDPDLKCYPLTAFATPTDKSQKYSVPTTPDLYTAFNVKAPWSGTQYIRSFRSIIDNGQVLHHWLLFRQLNGGQEAVIPNVLGAHPDGEMLYGWAPGGDNMWFDPDVGMEVPANSVFQLEMHYNNRTGRPTPDASGVEICVTPNKPAHIAGLSWVGTDAINGTRAVGNCTHSSRQPIRLIASQPHMHTKGTHMKVDLTRAGGGVETIHDQPFDFNFQRAYVHDVDIMPGDRLTTTCTYSAPARFGKRTSDEMCYFFAIHWPRGTLARSNFNSIIHGPNTCID